VTHASEPSGGNYGAFSVKQTVKESRGTESRKQEQKAKILARQATNCNPEEFGSPSYSRSIVSSIATLPSFSTVMTLCTALNPVRVMSTT
jgi:hypothetical protein